MKQTMTNLKQLIRAGRGIIPAYTVIVNGNLVNVMSSEIYKADVAIYEDTIVAVGNVTDYIGPDTKTIDAEGRYLVPGLIDGHIHSECSKLSITSYAKAVVPRGTTSMISGLDEYISVSGLEGLQEVFEEIKSSPLKVFWGAPYKTPYTFPQSTVAFNFTKEVHEQVQQWPECYGVWETVREYVTEEDENTLGAIEVAEAGKLNYELNAPKRSSVLTSKLKCAKTTKEDFEYKVGIKNGCEKVLSMDVKGPFVRKRRDVVLEVKDGIVQPSQIQDAAMVSVIERFGRNGNKSLAFCSGWNLKRGAMASTAAPDDNNLIVMGANAEDMSIAVNHLIENGGGQVVVADGEILEFLPLPVGGIVSDLEPEVIAEWEKRVNKAANQLGCDLPEPLMYMFFLPITAIPDYAITDVGPVDCIALDTFDPILELIESK